MTAITINDFGGIAPRVPARMLAATAGQRNHNLTVSSPDFRPLAEDLAVAAGEVGASTLYRLSRNPDGTLRTGDAEGWIVEAQDKSYAPGQVNDDATERTAVSFNDGTAAPRVIDATGEDRLLGVPAPGKPQVSQDLPVRADSEWVKEVLAPMVASLVGEYMQGARMDGGLPIAGATSMYGGSQRGATGTLQYNLERPATGLLADALPGETLPDPAPNGSRRIYLTALPQWGVLNEDGFRAALYGIEHPGTGSQLIGEEAANSLIESIEAYFDPGSAGISSYRSQLDDDIPSYFELAALSTVDATGAPSPIPLREIQVYPNGGKWAASRQTEYLIANKELYTTGGVKYNLNGMDPMRVLSQMGELFAGGKNNDRAHWYNPEYVDWWTRTYGGDVSSESDLARANNIRSRIEAATSNIEARYSELMAAVQDKLESLLSSSTLGVVDSDPTIETRFYLATLVNDWGWESGPGELSDMLDVEVDEPVDVVLDVAALPTDRHITAWRLYRTNTGSSSTAYQFVAEVPVDTGTFTDDVANDELGEVCPTLTWREPPFRLSPDGETPKGTDPHLRGLVTMPNGIVAGFIDNFVAFCEPYYPYAWPVAYQVTTDTPIVGLGSFGQTLFVGTRGSPYLISGADSASMSAVKLDDEQACVSRRSIVSVGGGVVFASPDGLCFASASGVELVTAAFFSREDWQALQPETLFAVGHEGAYYFWVGEARQCYVLDVAAAKLGTLDLPATAAFRDRITDGLYVVHAVTGEVVRAFGGQLRRQAAWLSKKITLPRRQPYAWLRVLGEQSPLEPVRVRWWGDGAVRYEVDVKGIEPVRLPPGRWLEHEIEVISRARVSEVRIAGNTDELRS